MLFYLTQSYATDNARWEEKLHATVQAGLEDTFAEKDQQGNWLDGPGVQHESAMYPAVIKVGHVLGCITEC